ncbi:hypothetical protein TrST_g750 [Triparma strigata]|uniref:SGNH hydrolase-type esterase domain-containing protein n=1 Tax=Triparma strigata TaxID=1606541 RepID=A0A9W7EBL8_9STRA|nr:hypothetical protein TrST_g750 [Triparma strigata]
MSSRTPRTPKSKARGGGAPFIPPKQGINGFESTFRDYSMMFVSGFVAFALAKIQGKIYLPEAFVLPLTIACGCVAAFALLGLYLLNRGTMPPSNDPHSYCANGKKKPALVFLGDSITHQTLSGEFCKMVAKAKQELAIVNCGQNSIATDTVLNERVDWVVACDPKYVSVMIGTNDIKGIYKPEWAEGTIENFSVKEGEITFATFRRNMTSIVANLIKYTDAKIAIHTLPPMGEDLECEANTFIYKANSIIKEVVDRVKSPRVTLIDTFGNLERFLLETTTKEQREKGLKVDNFGDAKVSIALKRLVGMGYDACGEPFGLAIMCDALHLNDTGAKIVADAVVEWIGSS